MKRLMTIGVAALAAIALVGFAGDGAAAPAAGAGPEQRAVPRNTSPPTVQGDLRQGQVLTATNGAWTNNPTSYTYQWQRCAPQGGTCADIFGASGRTYRLTAQDVGREIKVLVRARNAAGTSKPVDSARTSIVATNTAPSNTVRPTISGTPQVGQELRADPGTWTGTPQFGYQWQRCDVNGANCAVVSGATSQSYGVRTADVGGTLRVEVGATNVNGTARTTSDRTEVVRAAGSSTGGGTTTGNAVNVSQVTLPNRLLISSVRFIPTTIGSRTQPIVGRFRITDTQGRGVLGALVFAQGVPFGRVSTPPEVRTDAAGFAEIRFQPQAALVFRRGASIVFFVRARKAGENLLAGVSARRLVQVRVVPR